MITRCFFTIMSFRIFTLFLLSTLFSACTISAHPSATSSPQSLRSGNEPRFINLDLQDDRTELFGQLADKRVIFIGEVHDSPSHHQNQLRVIQGMFELDPNLAIGIEYFQQPFQQYLDDYIAGKLDDRELLTKSEYFVRWKFDYRLVQPIFEFARNNKIPLLALNVPYEIHNKVFQGGMGSLNPAELKQIPDFIQPANSHYLQHLRSVFDYHPQGSYFNFFLEGVLLWDEAMAAAAARYLDEHPKYRMVVLAGMSHIIYGDGIPERINRRLGDNQSAVIINGYDFGKNPGIADFQLATDDSIKLPTAGKLGLTVADFSNYSYIADISPGSAAEVAGLSVGDRIVTFNGMSVSNILDLKSIMYDKVPGDQAQIIVLRDRPAESPLQLHFTVELR